jgi:hypothetical protein
LQIFNYQATFTFFTWNGPHNPNWRKAPNFDYNINENSGEIWILESYLRQEIRKFHKFYEEIKDEDYWDEEIQKYKDAQNDIVFEYKLRLDILRIPYKYTIYKEALWKFYTIPNNKEVEIVEIGHKINMKSFRTRKLMRINDYTSNFDQDPYVFTDLGFENIINRYHKKCKNKEEELKRKHPEEDSMLKSIANFGSNIPKTKNISKWKLSFDSTPKNASKFRK